jgi:PAS domain S-box-containing protein
MDDNGKRYGWITLMSDISERKKTEEALKQSEEKFRELTNNSIDAVVAVDSDMRIIIWNHGAEKIFGYTEKEILGQISTVLFIENVRDTVIQWHAHFRKTGENPIENQIIETIGIKKDGNSIPVEFSLSIRKIGNDYISTAIIRDISVRKEAEEALKQSEEKFRELINTSNDGIVAIDTQRKFIVWNKGAEKLLGYTEKEILGLSVMTIFPASEQKDVAREFVALKNTGTSPNINIVFETNVLKKDCSLLPVDISISARKTEGGYICTAIMRDITVRKASEEKLRQIDQMKSEFLSNVSHELRTPLQSIGGFTKLIMNGQVEDAATQQEFLQIIDRETMHLGNLINGLLDMSRLEAGRFRIYKKLVPARDVFIDSLQMFRSLAREKNITLTENVAPEIPEMEIDNERLRQVIINLIGNAIKFSEPDGSVAINVEKQPNELLFQVTDHGIGISEESQKHLFERFYRADGETVRGGTGLGLYISKQIIDAHGGRIWAESKFGEGSTFNFTLPLNGKGGNGNGQENTHN